MQSKKIERRPQIFLKLSFRSCVIQNYLVYMLCRIWRLSLYWLWVHEAPIYEVIFITRVSSRDGGPLFFLRDVPLSESHPNWCMQIVRNTLKRKCYVSDYTKSIENIINITFYTLRLNSVFTTNIFWLDIAFNVFHVWYAREMNMKHFY